MNTLEVWIAAATDKNETRLRRAISIVLNAIAQSKHLQPQMLLKGGILMAVGYNSPRHTTDIDFSTQKERKEFDVSEFRDQFEISLSSVVSSMGSGMDCRVQNCVINPPGEDKRFPSVTMTVGYAVLGESEHKKLAVGKCPHVVSVDYSLNEPEGIVDHIETESGFEVRCYSLEDMVAEKFRALIQQQEKRKSRGQDIYDLHRLLMIERLGNSAYSKGLILQSLKIKAAARDISVLQTSMAAEEVKRSASIKYKTLTFTDTALVSYDEAYDAVRAYYESLPWPTNPA